MSSNDPISGSQMGSGNSTTLTLGDILAIIGRQRSLALTAATVTMVIIIAAAALKTPLYEAQATLALDRGRRPVDFDPRAQFDPYTGNFTCPFRSIPRHACHR
jgi:uncharacterized protein involved in exopolysaccharide biosynthesis